MVSSTTLTWYVDLSLSQRAIDGVRTERGSTPPLERVKESLEREGDGPVFDFTYMY